MVMKNDFSGQLFLISDMLCRIAFVMFFKLDTFDRQLVSLIVVEFTEDQLDIFWFVVRRPAFSSFGGMYCAEHRRHHRQQILSLRFQCTHQQTVSAFCVGVPQFAISSSPQSANKLSAHLIYSTNQTLY